MKVTSLLSVLIIFIILVVLPFGFLVNPTSKDESAPKFIKNLRTPASVRSINYDFLSPRPFERGRMWISTDQDSVVYDMEKRRVLGQLTNAAPIMLYGEPPQLLCCQYATFAAPNTLNKPLFEFLAKISLGRIKVPSSSPGDTYWILDLGHNTATRLGEIPGNPNTFYPSPDFHYSFTPRFAPTSTVVYLLDLQRPSIQRFAAPGWAYDWWDDTQILVKTINNDFVLWDVRKGATTALIPFEKLTALLQEKSIEDDPRQTHPFAIWNGRNNDFYLTTHQQWLAEPSFLIKVERPVGRLKLVSSHFGFGWSDHLDSTGRYYLFSGTESGHGSDAVFLRLLGTGREKVLVASNTNKYSSLSRFYGDSVIYVRSNALWQISLDGSSNQRLFPPPMTLESVH